MLKRHKRATATPEVTITIDGAPYQVPSTLSVAAAVLMHQGAVGYRRHAAGGHRAPLCMMGVCHDCLITIDDAPNRQGCLVTVEQGMRVRRQLDEETATAYQLDTTNHAGGDDRRGGDDADL
ncbi:(2Fe-2S)-binding protein [Halomonas sp. DN3]|uniref:(2Fe-2S)-binding protein n=1 Tax=Halomonas sp. DN3 TaxID=2953657 RepID=UPI00209D8870|nr:(2Fe-2S)-binding protein [Halomonas sp. DN3]USZ49406.1 (2Fe-2S)-binding protein [Halomonas sp. DN3]